MKIDEGIRDADHGVSPWSYLKESGKDIGGTEDPRKGRNRLDPPPPHYWNRLGYLEESRRFDKICHSDQWKSTR